MPHLVGVFIHFATEIVASVITDTVPNFPTDMTSLGDMYHKLSETNKKIMNSETHQCSGHGIESASYPIPKLKEVGTCWIKSKAVLEVRFQPHFPSARCQEV